MTSKMEEYIEKKKISQPWANFYTRNLNKPEYVRGEYYFEQGTVLIYSEPMYAHFIFVYQGYNFHLCLSKIKKPLSRRQLTLKARKFALSSIKELELSKT